VPICRYRLFMHEAPLIEPSSNPRDQPALDTVVPGVRRDRRWLVVIATMPAVMTAVIVAAGIVNGPYPANRIELLQPKMPHLAGEFATGQLGTAIEADGSATVRLIAGKYDFVPHCVQVPADTNVTFRLTSTDGAHGFQLPDTGVNTVVVPGFVAEVHTIFATEGKYVMPCLEFCGLGHQAMWSYVKVVPKQLFAALAPIEWTRCAPR
jgi:cytochrome c oxidase subunit 2